MTGATSGAPPSSEPGFTTGASRESLCTEHPSISAEADFRARRLAYWDSVHAGHRGWAGRYYHQRLSQIYRVLVPPGRRVYEPGCGAGDLLAAVESGRGHGIDLCERAVQKARSKHPSLSFEVGDVLSVVPTEEFDYVIGSDLLNELWDVESFLKSVLTVCHERTRLIFNTTSRLWDIPLGIADRLGATHSHPQPNWVTVGDLENLLLISGFEPIRSFSEILVPLRIPGLTGLLNRLLVKFPPFSWFALTNFVIARPRPGLAQRRKAPTVSVVVPARNEAGNIRGILERVPMMGSRTEIIFVEGHSSDDTVAVLREEVARGGADRAAVHQQAGHGKADAVRLGFDQARGDILMILDADLTVVPEDLIRFYDAISEGAGDFINGVRLVYPMEDRAMRFPNLVANKAFSWMFSWLLGQRVRDTLCGSKVMWRRDYQEMTSLGWSLQDLDPFGDFHMLIGAGRLSLRILDVPVRYRARTYGTTNIRRWRDGLRLSRMFAVAVLKSKLF